MQIDMDNLSFDIKKNIYEYLQHNIDKSEINMRKSMFKMKTIYNIIELCREMGFVKEFRSEISGDYADPTNLYFFWHKPKHYKKTIMVARSKQEDFFVTSCPAKKCHVCTKYDCNEHQKIDLIVEELLIQKLQNATIEIINKKDQFTDKQYMEIFY